MKLKNYDELIPQIARMILDHLKNHTRYQEDIYLYVDADGVGTLELFQNSGGNSWIDDNHYTLCSLREDYTDWTYTFSTMGSIADVLGWTRETLLNRAAAWYSEKGWQTDAVDIDFRMVREFIEKHQPLLDKICEADEQCLEESFPESVEVATDILDSFLQEVE